MALKCKRTPLHFPHLDSNRTTALPVCLLRSELKTRIKELTTQLEAARAAAASAASGPDSRPPAVSFAAPEEATAAAGAGDDDDSLPASPRSRFASVSMGRSMRLGRLDSSTDTSMAGQLSLLKSIPMFMHFSESDFTRLATSIVKEDFSSGSIIMEQGGTPDAFYIIITGKVAVHKAMPKPAGDGEAAVKAPPGMLSGSPFSLALDRPGIDLRVSEAPGGRDLGPVVAELSRGFFFGERALLTGEPQLASVVAVDNVVCLKLSKSSFSMLQDSCGPALMSYATQHFANSSAEYLALASHCQLFGLLVDSARSSGVDVNDPVESDARMPTERALVDAMSMYAPELSLEDVIDRVTKSLATLVSAACVRVAIHDAEAQELLAVGSGVEDVDSLPLREGGILAACLRTKKVIVVDDTATDVRFRNPQAGDPETDPSDVDAQVSMGWGMRQVEIDRMFNELAADMHAKAADQLAGVRRRKGAGLDSDVMSFSTSTTNGSSMIVAPVISPTGQVQAVLQILHRTEEAAPIATTPAAPATAAGIAPGTSKKKKRLSMMGTWTSKGAASAAKAPALGTMAEGDEEGDEDEPVTAAAGGPAIPFSERDVQVVAGVADTFALGLTHVKGELNVIFGTAEMTPLHTENNFFRIRVMGGGNLDPPDSWVKKRGKKSKWPKPIDTTATVHLMLVHGGTLLAPEVTSEPAPLVCKVPEADAPSEDGVARPVVSAMWGQWLPACIRFCNLPTATRVVFKVTYKDGTTAGWAGCSAFKYDNALRTGKLDLRMWSGDTTPEKAGMTTSLSNKYGDPHFTGELKVEFHRFENNVVKVPGALAAGPDHTSAQAKPKAGAGVGADWASVKGRTDTYVSMRATDAEFRHNKPKLQTLFASEPLYRMTPEEKLLVWKCRHHLLGYPEALPKFLQSVRWDDCMGVEEAYLLMDKWRAPEPLDALQLLDVNFPDPKVRAYAVQCLERMDDEELRQYMLQLTQVLKFESFLDSALARFLLRRALRNPRLIGHVLFWYLKAEMHIPEVASRYGVLIENYLRNAGAHRTVLGHQMFVMAKLEETAEHVKAADDKKAMMRTLREELPRIVFPENFQLPISPYMVADKIVVDKCRVMTSKKLPLWLTFTRGVGETPPPDYMDFGDGETHKVLFKAGDDLRQDQLTLQILGIMDKLWKAEGLDLNMSPYRVISTGDEVGMVEVVTNSNTLAGITKDGTSTDGSSKLWAKLKTGYNAMYNDKDIRLWLESQDCNVGKMEDVEEMFARSAAGYCVATYILGLGDRHNDNLMCTRDGKFFHIDFGHFLGNFKSKMGFKREKAPFVLTPSMVAAMGGKESDAYGRFLAYCTRAYNILRKKSNLLITLFFLMISCGIPELQAEEDLDWLKMTLLLGKTDTEAADRFKELIEESLSETRTQLMHAVHSVVHG